MTRLSTATSLRNLFLRVLLAVVLLSLTVPWWPGLDGRLFGLPTWAVYAWIAALVYAALLIALLQFRWDAGDDDEA